MNTLNLEEKILAVITESLPQAHVGVLRDYLQKAAQNERELAAIKNDRDMARKELAQVSRENSDLRTKIADLTRELQAEQGLRIEIERKHAAALDAEKNVELHLARQALSAMARERDTVIRLAEIVFRNPRQIYQTSTSERETQSHFENSEYGGRNEKAGTTVERTATITQETKDAP